MTDLTIHKLRDDLSTIEAEVERHHGRIEDLQQQVEQHRAQIADLRGQAEHFRFILNYYGIDAPGQPVDSDAEETTAEDTAPEQQPQKMLKNAMWKILEAEGTPLHYRDIYQRLVHSGINVPGQDPARNVNAHLSADSRFANVRRGHWGLRSWGPATPPRPPLIVDPAEGDINPRDDTPEASGPHGDTASEAIRRYNESVRAQLDGEARESAPEPEPAVESGREWYEDKPTPPRDWPSFRTAEQSEA